MSSDHPENPEQKIIDRVTKMTFSCIYCDTGNPVPLSAVGFQGKGSGPHVNGFFICPQCQTKFLIKIEDLGKVGLA